MQRLVTEISARGRSVSTIKQAPPEFDVDQPDKDSHRHRTAGATEVLLSARKGFALMHELRGAPAPGLEVLLSKLAPVDLVLIDGYAQGAHPKLKIVSSGGIEGLHVRAVAAASNPVFAFADTAAIAGYILDEVGL
jgi:molybdopterin-guanine dinucleotide biosynthesis protein MobB